MLTSLFSLLALAATVSAQYASEPFAIRITGKTNSSIDGMIRARLEKALERNERHI